MTPPHNFSWDGDGNGQEYQCNAVLATSRELDFALLRIAPLAGAGPVRPARLVASGSSTTNRDNLRLIHHMACLPKQLSDRCTVLRTPAPGWIAESGDVRLYHDCGSNPGSSGAPLFDREGAVAALHHQGRDLDQQTCKPIDNVNKAIRIQAILKSLCAANPALGARLDPTECRLSFPPAEPEHNRVNQQP
ncbi:serine protease [uncultured Lamprocystis sp.]|uniref:S1 family peptidase n=1 Tax=uncultured Lamprocystis sp. TaxID=543132 RepID=UPI0025E9EAE7|nr:serine protease [uncultured Lamprocystis sp.]